MPMVQKVLKQTDTDIVTLTANTANLLTPIIKVTCPRGLGMVFPGKFPLVMKLKSAVPAELPDDTKIYFGIKKPGQTDFIKWFTARTLYEPWGNLTVTQQRNADYQGSIIMDTQIPFIPIVEEEELYIGVLSTVVSATAQTTFSIPYVERGASEITEELALRMQWIGA